MDQEGIGMYETERDYAARLRQHGASPASACIKAWKAAMSRDIDSAPDFHSLLAVVRRYYRSL